MSIAIFIIAVVVSMPIVAIVLVSIASRREDSALSLGGPPRTGVQAAARRIVDFNTEATADWLRPADLRRIGSSEPVRGRAPRPRRSAFADDDPHKSLMPTKMNVRPAA